MTKNPMMCEKIVKSLGFFSCDCGSIYNIVAHRIVISCSSLAYRVTCLSDKDKLKKMRWVWAFLLCIAYPLTILLPFINAYLFMHVPFDTVVPFELSNALLFTSSILFGFTSLIVVSKEWIDKRIWAVLIPPLALIVLSGVAIGNLALGTANGVQVLLYCSAAFNANVVSTGFVVGYVTQQLPKKT
jgi:hypothetical protein